ncbi:macro domain-containing protein [Pseudonocardia kongjuensis]|uniref:macro domain-containing protein n=1 Tax=Pseudonocardia kongjuensis TaxID=102227 RepID=UPI0031D410D0
MIVAIAIGWALLCSWPRPIEQRYQQPKTEVRVFVGDLFDQEGNVVVGMSTTFDTETPHVISSDSVQGQLLARIYNGDHQALDNDLTSALANVSPTESFKAVDAKRGKQDIYPLGTVVVLNQTPRKLYFCVAYTEMQSDCTVKANVDGIWTSLNELWRLADTRGNGDPISIGVIGGGQSRLSGYLPVQDAIRLTVLSYIFASRARPVSRQLNIVVRSDDFKNLDALELQAFLNSLRPS